MALLAVTLLRMRAASISVTACLAIARVAPPAYADTPEGVNREHALFGADRCIAVSSSDGSPALTALDAQFVIQSSSGQRVMNAQDFFVGPNVDITRLTATKPEEIVTAIRLPKNWAGANFYFEKVTDRNAWDFPLVNVAVAIRVANGTIQDSRIVVGGVSAVPHRLSGAEEIIKGKAQDANIATIAGQSSTRDARPVNYNGFKIPADGESCHSRHPRRDGLKRGLRWSYSGMRPPSTGTGKSSEHLLVLFNISSPRVWQ